MEDATSGELRVKLGNEMNKAYKEVLQGEMQTLKLKLKEDLRTQIGVIEENLVAKYAKNNSV